MSWAILIGVVVLFWLGHAIYAAYLSGWQTMVRRYHDRAEAPITKITRNQGTLQSGTDLVGKLGVCASGLRVRAGRYCIFSRGFFVPWAEIAVFGIQSRFFEEKARLVFGEPEIGSIALVGTIADRIGRSVPAEWPEGLIPEETMGQIAEYRMPDDPLLVWPTKLTNPIFIRCKRQGVVYARYPYIAGENPGLAA